MSDRDSKNIERSLESGMRSLLAEIIASSNDAVVGKDLNGIVTSWNSAAERLFGFSAAEMIGQPIRRIIPLAFMALVVGARLLQTPLTQGGHHGRGGV